MDPTRDSQGAQWISSIQPESLVPYWAGFVIPDGRFADWDEHARVVEGRGWPLVLGVVVNVAVAWSCAVWSVRFTQQGDHLGLSSGRAHRAKYEVGSPDAGPALGT